MNIFMFYSFYYYLFCGPDEDTFGVDFCARGRFLTRLLRFGVDSLLRLLPEAGTASTGHHSCSTLPFITAGLRRRLRCCGLTRPRRRFEPSSLRPCARGAPRGIVAQLDTLEPKRLRTVVCVCVCGVVCVCVWCGVCVWCVWCV